MLGPYWLKTAGKQPRLQRHPSRPEPALSARTPTVFLDPKSREPLYLQIANSLMQEIHRGRLHPGDALPGYRTLGERMGVSRNTVMEAYRELQAEASCHLLSTMPSLP